MEQDARRRDPLNGPIATAFCYGAADLDHAGSSGDLELAFSSRPRAGSLISDLSLGERPDRTLLGRLALILVGVVMVNVADWRSRFVRG